MRIDFNPAATPELTRGNGSVGATAVGPELANPNTPITQTCGPGDDVAELSSGSDVVANLKAQLDGIPDIRQQRVESLQQAVADGSFQVSPQRIADAMLTGANPAPGK